MALRNGDSRSCGCFNRDVHRELWKERWTTHGHASRGEYSPTYRVWVNLQTRKRHQKYDGITVCERWRDSFETFLADMGERPEGLTIDRIDNDKGYEPGNCRWATQKEQQNNRRNNRLITVNGRTQTLAQWAEETGFNRKTISRRLDLGWSAEKALSVPPKLGRNQYEEH